MERLHGTVSELFDWRDPPPGTARLARLHTVDTPGLVLGSTQQADTADQNRAAAEGVEIVRRHSGGAAVLLLPGGQVWVDFFIAATDPLWSDDVTLAALWAGELWSSVVSQFVAEPCRVHSGRLVADRWGRLVCFAGAGPGEVFVGGLKVAGVSQRRGRNRARIQTTVRLRTPPVTGVGSAPAGRANAQGRLDELELLELAPAERAAGRRALKSRCSAIPAVETDVIEALLQALEDPR